jgi:hypothetical protein
LLQPVLRRPAKGLSRRTDISADIPDLPLTLGQAYIGAYMDKDGAALDGAETYRLRVPAKHHHLRREHPRLDRQ